MNSGIGVKRIKYSRGITRYALYFICSNYVDSNVMKFILNNLRGIFHFCQCMKFQKIGGKKHTKAITCQKISTNTPNKCICLLQKFCFNTFVTWQFQTNGHEPISKSCLDTIHIHYIHLVTGYRWYFRLSR